MALTKKDTYNLLKEISGYGVVLYYLIEEKPKKKKIITISDIESLIYKENMEQVELVFPRLLSKIELSDIEEANRHYKQQFTKKKCIENLLDKHKNRHLHLQEIKDIALTEELACSMIKENTYEEAMNLLYTEYLLEYLELHPRDQFLSTKEVLNNYREALEKLKEENEKKLNSNISNYYISTITE